MIKLSLKVLFLIAVLTMPAIAAQYSHTSNPAILQMHDSTTWEQSCLSYDNLCEVPVGTYQVKLMNLNWDVIETLHDVHVSSSEPLLNDVRDIVTASNSCVDNGTSIVVCNAECPAGKQATGLAHCNSFYIEYGEIEEIDQNGNIFRSLNSTGIQMNGTVSDTGASCRYEFPYATQNGILVPDVLTIEIAVGARCM